MSGTGINPKTGGVSVEEAIGVEPWGYEHYDYSDYPDFEVTQVPNSRVMGAPEQFAFPMSMRVREGDTALKERLEKVIVQHQSELTSILRASGVTLYEPAQGIPQGNR